jgi:pilus assembly protein CpaE
MSESMELNDNDPTTIFIISGEKKIIKSLQSTLNGLSNFRLLGSSLHSEKIIEILQEKKPAIVLFDCNIEDENSLLKIDEIASRYNNGLLIAILPENQIKLSDQVVLAGARAIIYNPFTEANLLLTLRRMQEVIKRSGTPSSVESVAPAKQVELGSSIVFYSPKGGVGSTTLAVNTAIAMQHELKKEVLLIDGKNCLGHVALMLNLRTANSMADLTTHAEKLDESLVNQVIVKHYSGISILASPIMISKGHEIHAEELFKVLTILKQSYPYIVIDTGNYLDSNTVTYMDMSEHIFLVINPNIASLRDSRQFIDVSDSLSYSKEKIHLILNQAGRKTEIKVGEIEKAMRKKLFGTIPVDEDACLNSLNEGLPIVLMKGNHPISKAIKKITSQIIRTISETANSTLDTNQPDMDVLTKSSYFG